MDRIDKKAVAAIEKVLKSRLRRMGFEKADIYPGQDHDGEPAIFVDVQHRFVREPIDVTGADNIETEVRRALEAVGENRFPYVRLHFDERQEVARNS